MISPGSLFRSLCWLVCGAGWWLSVHGASAQQPDRMGDILHPNLDRHAEGFGNAFIPSASSENRGFFTRLFGGSHPASNKVSLGSFHAVTFASGKGGYASPDFTTKKSPLAGQSASQYSRTYDTKTMAVSEDRAADKTATTRNYEPSGKLFTEKGKRQDSIDELRRQKNLTSDQIREILNKNK